MNGLRENDVVPKRFFGAQKDFLFGIRKILLGVKGEFLMAVAELSNRKIEASVCNIIGCNNDIKATAAVMPCM